MIFQKMKKYVLLLALCCINGIKASGSQDKTLVRHKRWLWGGCGLILNCDKCINSHVCVKCEAGYIFMEYRSTSSQIVKKTIQCTKTCPKGYKIKNKTSERTCVYTDKVCKVPHCKTCHPRRTSSCMKCSRGFYLYRPSVKDSAKCVRKCPRWCSATVLRDGTKECILSATECRERSPNCDRCLDKIWCRKCKKGFLTYFNSGNLTMNCVKACPPKYRQVKSEYFGLYCAKREKRKKCKTIANCEYCPKKSSCKKCSKNYLKFKRTVLDDIKCVLRCPDGFKQKGKRCAPLKARGCQDDFCMACKAGLYRVRRGLCLRRCPKGHYTVGSIRKFCLKCPRGCQKCASPSKCYKCHSKYHRLKNKQGLHCVRYCPPGYKTRQHKQRSVCHRV